ncbi:Tetraspanin family [Popillia japonica]|uniref:Tetraspanin family n=1 Tax=Popillia japonica TaxID=7064 RepID=A0AAW1IZT1_POPJA
MPFFTDSWKAILLGISTIFLIAGIGITGIGIWGTLDLSSSIEITIFWIDFSITEIYQEPKLGVIGKAFLILGPVITAISFTGFWGAKNERKWMLKLYTVLLIVILLLQIVIGICFICNIKNGQSFLPEGPWDVAEAEEHTKYIDTIQKSLKCCGYYDPSEMRKFAGTYPASCCNKYRTFLSVNEIAICQPYKTGCSYKYVSYIKIGGLIYGAFIGFQVWCIVAATIVLYSIKKGYVSYTILSQIIVR